VGILTFDGSRLGEAHLRKLGIDPSRCVVRGAPHKGALQRHIRRGERYVHDDIARELAAEARAMVEEEEEGPAIAFILLECTNMPPFSRDIQMATGLPVYDVHTAGLWFYSGLVNSRPGRWGAIPEDDVGSRT
jgi:hypothetical protein